MRNFIRSLVYIPFIVVTGLIAGLCWLSFLVGVLVALGHI
jgi:hypothetical protein